MPIKVRLCGSLDSACSLFQHLGPCAAGEVSGIALSLSPSTTFSHIFSTFCDFCNALPVRSVWAGH